MLVIAGKDACLVGFADGCGRVLHVELFVNVSYVVGYGVRTDRQFLGNLFFQQAVSQLIEDFRFSFGEFVIC